MMRVNWKWDGPFPKEFAVTVKEEFTKAMLESVTKLETEVAQGTPVGVGIGGHLRTSIRGEVLTHLRGVVGVIGDAGKYADIIEMGRRPGPISKEGVANIMLWVHHKLQIPSKKLKSVTFLVSRKIRTKGFKGKFMFAKAEKKMARSIVVRFEQAKEIVERLLSDK